MICGLVTTPITVVSDRTPHYSKLILLTLYDRAFIHSPEYNQMMLGKSEISPKHVKVISPISLLKTQR
jgi:hypothetical protein